MDYKRIVQEIADLPWQEASPGDIILLSRGTAVEFAESLRLAGELYPKDQMLQEMMYGELRTGNMAYEDYKGPGDHWEYLDHFIRSRSIEFSSDKVGSSIERYQETIRQLLPKERAMTVFSREEELAVIFQKLLEAHDWDHLGYGFYPHYLASHIEFDSGDKGHHYLTSHFPLHETVLEKFYRIRLELYSCLF